jgi:hypothetical protein
MSLERLLRQMTILAKTNRAELAMVNDMLVITTDRIFTNGLDANGSSIGTYSDGYMKLRKKVNYGGSTKVILQGLDGKPKGSRSNPVKRGTVNYQSTGQMFQDFSVINKGKKLGLGFKNSFNAEKSEWVEATYKKSIFKSTKDEASRAVEIFEANVIKILNG